MTKIAIRSLHLSKYFDDTAAVDDVSLTLPQGQFLALLGPSGCGKTTTLRLLAGFESPDQGEIYVDDRPVFRPGLNVPPEKRRVGMVFQEYALFPHMTVADNVAYGLPKNTDRPRRVDETLELVGLRDIKARMPHELSGGQQQRVALARALAPNPALVLLDEPFSNLDAGLRGQVRVEVRQILRDAGATVIFVTHDQEEAFSLADQVAVMMNGRLLQLDSPENLYRRPATRSIAAFLGHTNFLTGQVSRGRLTYELGHLPTNGQPDGPVQVMIRPEDLRLTAAESGPATVVARSFYGHDQLIELQLDSGSRLHSRVLGSSGQFRPGQRVAIAPPDDVVLYPQ
jgi:iron(III) transport system ATP-binding protein